MTEQHRLTVLLDEQVRRSFDGICGVLETNASAVLRDLIVEFLATGAPALRADYTRVNIGAMPDASRERKTARLTILIEPRTKKQFEESCVAMDLTSSQVVRRLIRQWMEDNDNPRASASATKPKRHR
jgi:hypothetical protein